MSKASRIMHRHFFTALIIAIAACLSTNALTQNSVVAEKPKFRAGDKFSYCRFDLRTDEKRDCYTLEYVETRRAALGDLEHVFSQRNAQGVAFEIRTTDDLATKFRGTDGATFEPHNYTYKFPFGVGSRWEGQYDLRFPDNPSWNNNRTKVAEVVAYEEIEVPAGKFKAFKIKYDNWRNDSSRRVIGGRTADDELIYYCPELGVLCLYESGAQGTVRIRLVEVRPAAGK